MKKIMGLTLSFLLIMGIQTTYAQGTEDLINHLQMSDYDSFTVSNVKLVLTPKEKAALALSKAFRDKNIKPMITENGRVTFAYGLTIPSIICSPLMVTDIEFEEGEFLNDVIFGDTARWHVTLARAGNPEISHLIIKPLDAGLHTTAVITTNKRVYHLELRSQSKGYISYVGFVYPEDINNLLQKQLAEHQKKLDFTQTTLPTGQNVDIANLFFDYRITGSNKIKPIQVYNDGQQTFIKMAKTIQEMPVLMVRENGSDILVNYRINDNTIIVDELFSEAVLLAGVGRKQEKVVIKRR